MPGEEAYTWSGGVSEKIHKTDYLNLLGKQYLEPWTL